MMEHQKLLILAIISLKKIQLLKPEDLSSARLTYYSNIESKYYSFQNITTLKAGF
jgi:hypothetical protein